MKLDRPGRAPWSLTERLLLVGIALALVTACGLVGALLIDGAAR